MSHAADSRRQPTFSAQSHWLNPGTRLHARRKTASPEIFDCGSELLSEKYKIRTMWAPASVRTFQVRCSPDRRPRVNFLPITRFKSNGITASRGAGRSASSISCRQNGSCRQVMGRPQTAALYHYRILLVFRHLLERRTKGILQFASSIDHLAPALRRHRKADDRDLLAGHRR